ncbi:hypothetical protein HMN09_00300900 [Mycena chlorophos]|uniref:Uncharacterized protein n=1 Tax=Mycena chlorophos TaxID=658473 RepID=A0A8H6TL73_MYCCL|nr:hypothetical protein HMN09_00300900 [Mycena chlorophos]
MSQSNSSQSPSPRSTPDLDADYGAQMKDLLLSISPEMSVQQLGETRQKILALVSDHDETVTGLKRRLVDVENEANNPSKRTRRSRNHRTEGMEEPAGDFTPEELESAGPGRKMVILCALWLAVGEGGDTVSAPPGGSKDENDERQGQLRELDNIMPVELRPFMKRGWFAQALADGMKSQLANTAYRLRKDGLANLVDGLKVPKPARRHNASPRRCHQPGHIRTALDYFKRRIGWIDDTGKYSFFNIPFLHANETSKLDYNQLFRHPLLLKIWSCIIRGIVAPTHVMKKKAVHPRASTMQRIFNIQYTTPGAIAASAVWVVWMFSADETFADTGDVTDINYYERFNLYLEKILEGLGHRQLWAWELFQYWDEHLFPELNGSHSGGGAVNRDDDQREELCRRRV